MSNEFTQEERTIIAEYIYSYESDILVVNDADRLIDVLRNKEIIDKKSYITLKKAVKEKSEGLVEALMGIVVMRIPSSQYAEIMAEYFGRGSKTNLN